MATILYLVSQWKSSPIFFTVGPMAKQPVEWHREHGLQDGGRSLWSSWGFFGPYLSHLRTGTIYGSPFRCLSYSVTTDFQHLISLKLILEKSFCRWAGTNNGHLWSLEVGSVRLARRAFYSDGTLGCARIALLETKINGLFRLCVASLCIKEYCVELPGRTRPGTAAIQLACPGRRSCGASTDVQSRILTLGTAWTITMSVDTGSGDLTSATIIVPIWDVFLESRQWARSYSASTYFPTSSTSSPVTRVQPMQYSAVQYKYQLQEMHCVASPLLLRTHRLEAANKMTCNSEHPPRRKNEDWDASLSAESWSTWWYFWWRAIEHPLPLPVSSLLSRTAVKVGQAFVSNLRFSLHTHAVGATEPNSSSVASAEAPSPQRLPSLLSTRIWDCFG